MAMKIKKVVEEKEEEEKSCRLLGLLRRLWASEAQQRVIRSLVIMSVLSSLSVTSSLSFLSLSLLSSSSLLRLR